MATYEYWPTLVIMLSVTNVGSNFLLHIRVHVNLVNVTLNVGNDGFESVIGSHFFHYFASYLPFLASFGPEIRQ